MDMTNELNEIFSLIDEAELTSKQKNCLKLLSEEGWLVVSQYLDAKNIGYALNNDGNAYEIKFTAETNMSEERRKEFLSVGKGKNSKSKGFFGKLSAIFEGMLYSYDLSAIQEFNQMALTGTVGLNNASYWSLSGETVTAKEEKEWDGLEKSIIANLADDVSVGVRFGKIEMIVKKAF